RYLSNDGSRTIKDRLREAIHFPVFAFWLMYQIIKANFYVLYLSLHPRMREMIDPQVVKFSSEHLKGEFAHFVMAQSITLTPGTVTMLLEDGEFTVHALTGKTAEGLPSPMDQQVAKVFNPRGNDE
ncbi:MAG: Na+/H+ antiporter subunit E, partial [Bdellovibrionales bacterium]|nr:Na+/H+ antiporter subunit E [Bdellovibrionales bacterium]